ncbi:MAG: DUF4494 family protein [Akkermansia sp.]
MNFIITTVTYLNLDGKKATDTFLVQTDIFTHAEALTLNEAIATRQDFTVASVRRANFNAIIGDDTGEGLRYYKIKAKKTVLDEKTGKEKRIPLTYLVRADTALHAIQHLHQYSNLAGLDVTQLTLTPILYIITP